MELNSIKQMKRKTTLSVFFILVASILVYLGFSLINNLRIINENKKSCLVNTVEKAKRLDSLLGDGLSKVRVISSRSELDLDFLNSCVEENIFYSMIYLDSEEKATLIGTRPTEVSSSQGFLRACSFAKSGESGLEVVVTDDGRYLLAFYAPVKGEMKGTLFGFYDVDLIVKPYLLTEYYGVLMETYFFDGSGNLIASSHPLEPLMKVLECDSISQEAFDLNDDDGIGTVKIKGNSTGAYAVKLEKSDCMLLQVFPRALSFRIVNHANILSFILELFILLTLLVLFIVVGRHDRIRDKQIEVALEDAKKANEAKTLFLFNMSHDIRTPMNAIVGFTNLLKNSLDDREKTLDYIEKIQRSNTFLLSLINNVLEMARIESGKERMNLDVFEVQASIDSFLPSFEAQMAQKGIEFLAAVDIQHEYIISDKTKLEEIFLNLLSNALKYTTKGGTVALIVKEVPCEEEGYAIFHTTVSDTGIGMSQDFLPHLFEAFAREKSTTDRKIMGTGLGMSIVKKLVELMDGTIEVESTLGKGTKFTMTTKHRIANAEDLKSSTNEPEILDSVNFEGKRILLAEDNDFNAEITMTILEELGLKVERGEDGIVCFNMLEKSENGYYDMVLMDIQMPNMNGYDCAKNIRKLSDPYKAKIPIVAMTANAFESDRRAAYDAGMDGHLAKPIDINLLVRTLESILC